MIIVVIVDNVLFLGDVMMLCKNENHKCPKDRGNCCFYCRFKYECFNKCTLFENVYFIHAQCSYFIDDTDDEREYENAHGGDL